MHELSLMTSLMELIEREADRAGATRVQRVVVRVGSLSGVVPEFLESAFEYMNEGTAAQGAVFEVVSDPAQGRCPKCGHAYEMVEVVVECPSCGAVGVEVEGGQDVVLERLEIEVPDGQDSSG